MTRRPSSDATTFYGQLLPHPKLIPQLTCELRHGTKDAVDYAYLVYLDQRGVKWRIEPGLNEVGQATHLFLQQRNRAGQAGFHAQCFRADNTAAGLRAMVQYIKQVELLSRTRDSDEG